MVLWPISFIWRIYRHCNEFETTQITGIRWTDKQVHINFYLYYFRMGVRIRLYQAFTTTGCLSDRLSSTWTVVILLILSAITFWMQMYTDPISCFTPSQFTAAHVHYTHKHCWYANVITKAQDLQYGFSDYPELLPLLSENVVNENSQRTMYQWLPLILVFQALLFKLPDIIWAAGLSMLGLNIGKLNGISDGYGNLPNRERKMVGKQMARYLYHYVKSSPWGFITLLYIFIKSLFIVNAVSQFAMQNKYLATDNDRNTTHYSDLLFNNLNDNNASAWFNSHVFPKSVVCSFPIHHLQNIQRWTTQCTIPINNWYHLISALVWVWLLFIMMVTVMSCAVDAIKFILPVCRMRWVLVVNE